MNYTLLSQTIHASTLSDVWKFIHCFLFNLFISPNFYSTVYGSCIFFLTIYSSFICISFIGPSSIYLPIQTSISFLSSCSSIFLFICSSIHPSTHPFIHPPTHPSTHPSIHPPATIIRQVCITRFKQQHMIQN